MRADEDVVERAVVLARAVVRALADGAADALVGFAGHTITLQFVDGDSMPRGRAIMQKGRKLRAPGPLL